MAVAPASAGAAPAAVHFQPCPDLPSFDCGHLTVALDPSGAIPGTIRLALRRRRARAGSARDAIVVLDGGPGEAAIPAAADDARLMRSGLATRDLIVFDQRGTGSSGPLTCAALSSPTLTSDQVTSCANVPGAGRGLYTTADSVFDIEQIRRVLGYDRLVLYGTSYGTKVAERYAAAYPTHVAGLILDSVVPPNGPDIYGVSSFQALPRILTALCGPFGCPGVPDPAADLAAVVARVTAAPTVAQAVDSTGTVEQVSLNAATIRDLLFAGDFEPELRSDLPAAVHAAAAGDDGPLAYLIAHAHGSGPLVLKAGPDTRLLFYADECEELPFPWLRSDPPAVRLTKIDAAAAALPSGSFGPFAPSIVDTDSRMSICAYWPNADPAPEPVITTLPDVPTLLLEGAADIRTPVAYADVVKALIPDAAEVVVPGTAHSVLDAEAVPCAAHAVAAFFAGTPVVTDCTPPRPPSFLQPAAPLPATIAASPGGPSGVADQNVTVVRLTLEWAARQFAELRYDVARHLAAPGSQWAVGGLASGYAHASLRKRGTELRVTFNGFSIGYGISISGVYDEGAAQLSVAGPAPGALTATAASAFSGTFGGAPVNFTLPKSALVGLTAAFPHFHRY